ncbi:F0F1 ATP synthase subunit alpha [Butyrivibrio sp. AE2032]|uniref:F0F1 ATP synthase subunit alpha n=1 Tax=Butyrivibrio sp. AE2032 TaxID=1458463 RepID=UPI0009DD42D8|nr:F0F1 ATP synthase subunit alpha [Butyrivibrio sp. AE2032]
MNNTKKATLRYAATAPTQEQINSIKAVLSKNLQNEEVEIEAILDPSVGGGFIVNCGNFEYDWSDQGRAKQLRAELNTAALGHGEVISGRIITMLKEKVEDFELSIKGREVGEVTWVGDGIANVDGIEHAFYGEIIEFEDGTKGMAQDIRDDHIGCILFGDDTGIRQGTRAVRTYKEAGVPVGEDFIGRVIDALGQPVDGKGDIKESGYRPVENPAPGIVDRQPVNEPMETGILSIDTMFPIGRGQRELIIGDRQTGKTSIALDTIINQKGKDVICIYVAIGQKASTVAKIIQILKKNGAMDYSIVVSSTASDPSPLQYIAPYSATALAEYFMYHGKDVLIVYDDLSKHAVAYRALSLLLERPPGREAYPGDVFYLHSRLLERSSKLSSDQGGGSITALPIIETLAGDVSAYIPTNVISITDGQIFLESDLFFEGMRPAVNVGLSVSRVGSSAQTRAMKKATGSIRIDLAQYREMAVFTQFSSDLDEVTKKQLTHGNVLMELLKQPLEHPLAMHEQVIILIAVTSGRIDHIPVRFVREYKEKLISHFNYNCQEICAEITKSGDLTEALRKSILDEIDEFNKTIEDY